ncbi:MAG: nucleoside-diphosphate sugar epimerase/dehydratase [Clostridia bacterium]|nr:nucleoside-diphosphate sugar epimerase/dehydratase [Clostridia bacterium]MDD4047325.1 nucleoside-diphosphate sugar epimerase/dehydratase [Clostridia bacterium]
MCKSVRVFLLVIIDVILVNFALYGSLLLRFDGIIPLQYMESYQELTVIFTPIFICSFLYFGLYNRLWKYASIGELLAVFYAVTVSSLINISLAYFVIRGSGLPLPRTVLLLNWVLNIFFIGGSRLIWRLLRDRTLRFNNSGEGEPTLIVGAGDTGVMVVKELQRHYNGELCIVGFVDDDLNKQKAQILGISVLGTIKSIPELIIEMDIQEVILAIPSMEGAEIRKIVDLCQKTDVKIRILPGVYDLVEENVTVNHIREVQVEDLLGRDPIKADLEAISGYLHGQVVLVTGAGGSIGSELCRQIMQFVPRQLLLLDVCENNVYDIEMELREADPAIEIIPLVKDVRDKEAIENVFDKYHPQVIFHAAAHKHVPLMEANPEEAIKNNVRGTYNVASIANQYSSKKFVLISTDKAVNPTSVMGASKRLAEMVIQYMDIASETNYVAVRFGNVLDSRGSVIPLFKKQIASGGPVTVTHPEMVRYFMTIPEAVELVIQAGSLAKGGEIFVLDMGEPVKILDLANSLIKLSGFKPGKDIEIAFTGIRPGEKLYEELLTAAEGVNATSHTRIFVAKPNGLNFKLIEELIHNINNKILPKDYIETERIIKKFIPNFHYFQVKEVDKDKLNQLSS